MTSGLTQDDVALALDSAVGDVLAEAGIGSPPVDARTVAAANGLIVAHDNRQQARARFVRLRQRSVSTQGSILVRPEPRPERLQWAIAHEIGESRVEQIFRRLSIDPQEAGDAARERFANQLANRLLLPSAWFYRDALKYNWDLLALKLRYGTASHELIARRMLDCAPPIIMAVFDNGRLTWRRSNLPGSAPPLSPVERDCWRRASTEAIPCAGSDATCAVQAWPIHEPLWRREILRTEWQNID